MSEALVAQLILSALGIAGSMAGALVIIARKLGGNNGGSPNSSSSQAMCSREDHNILTDNFNNHLSICNERWIQQGKDVAEIKGMLSNLNEKYNHSL